MKRSLSVHHNRPGQKRSLSLLQVISSAEPTIVIENNNDKKLTLNISMPVLSQNPVEIGVADIEGKRSVYLRLSYNQELG